MRLRIVQAILLVLAACPSAVAASQPARPAITGISHMAVYTTDAAGAERFYAHDLGATKMSDPEDPAGVRYYFSPVQFVEVLPLPAGDSSNSRLAHVGWETASADGMRKYLLAQGVEIADPLHRGSDHSVWFSLKDPEGNELQFVQPPPANARPKITPDSLSSHMIHVGFLVLNRSAEDQFYRKVLGFRPYWYGGQKAGRLDWVSQQVPNGTDWLEYMLLSNREAGSANPRNIPQAQLGVMNHFSLGVRNMESTVTLLTREDRLSAKHVGPQIGLDGKWQYNLFDPDGTRVELMEFQPVTKPCCSPFTAANPTR
jgi:catechol 2,3-dioxygenase-like lactoylglutathione lyase family enzyme